MKTVEMGLNKQEKEVMKEKDRGTEERNNQKYSLNPKACVVLQLPACEKDSY